MNVRQLMTKEVVTAAPDDSIKDVARALVEHGISGMPVCDGEGIVVGVISEGDILYKERDAADRRGGALGWLLDGLDGPYGFDLAKAEARTAAEAMTAPAITIEPTRSAAAAARIMVEEDVNRLPVVSLKGELVGIITRADLVRAFTRSDDEIAREIREDILRRVFWVDPETIVVEVRDGEVQLAGQLETSTDAEVLTKLVRRVPGVLSVHSTVTHRVDNSNRARRLAQYR